MDTSYIIMLVAAFVGGGAMIGIFPGAPLWFQLFWACMWGVICALVRIQYKHSRGESTDIFQ